MLIKSPLLTQMSGSIGGMVGYQGKGGLTLRARAVPTDPATSFQVAVRNAMAQAATAWIETLTQAQRNGWELYAQNVPLVGPLGEPREVSGQNMYCRSNIPRIQAGVGRVDDAPTTFDLGSFTDPSATASAGSGIVSVSFTDTDAWANEDDAYMLVYCSTPQSVTRNFFKGPYQLALAIAGDSATPPTSPGQFNPVPPPIQGQPMFFRVGVSRADGRLNRSFRGEIVVTA